MDINTVGFLIRVIVRRLATIVSEDGASQIPFGEDVLRELLLRCASTSRITYEEYFALIHLVKGLLDDHKVSR